MKRTVARRVFSEVSKLSHEAKMVPTCAGFEDIQVLLAHVNPSVNGEALRVFKDLNE